MALADEKYLLLTTFRRDGTPVNNPVWSVGLDNGKIGFWTSSGSGKVKRLAHTSRVTLQPCDGRGRTRAGSTVTEGTAQVVSGEELELVRRRVKAKYGFMTKITKLLGSVIGTIKRKRIPYADRAVIVTVAES